MVEYTGRLQAENLRLAIVVSRFNEMITKGLLTGALEGLERYGVLRDQVVVVWVPGAFEIPLIAKKLACSGQYDSVVCLGAVIRGATTHFEHVAGQAAAGMMQAGLDAEIPIIFGVLTLETIEQGLERAGTKMGNKGFEAIQTAIEMVDLMRQLSPNKSANPRKKALRGFHVVEDSVDVL